MYNFDSNFISFLYISETSKILQYILYQYYGNIYIHTYIFSEFQNLLI